jgi:hypothetical protein
VPGADAAFAHQPLHPAQADAVTSALQLAAVAAVRWVVRQRLAWRVDRAIDLEAWRTAKGEVRLH